MGDVPDSPGLYAFSVQSPEDVHARVMFVGLTTHLWMVTKGRLPDGSSRPAQRYGRHKYAGATRVRVNREIARAHAQGLHIVHWLKPMAIDPADQPSTVLRAAEEALISRWRLCSTG